MNQTCLTSNATRAAWTTDGVKRTNSVSVLKDIWVNFVKRHSVIRNARMVEIARHLRFAHVLRDTRDAIVREEFARRSVWTAESVCRKTSVNVPRATMAYDANIRNVRKPLVTLDLLLTRKYLFRCDPLSKWGQMSRSQQVSVSSWPRWWSLWDWEIRETTVCVSLMQTWKLLGNWTLPMFRRLCREVLQQESRRKQKTPQKDPHLRGLYTKTSLCFKTQLIFLICQKCCI